MVRAVAGDGLHRIAAPGTSQQLSEIRSATDYSHPAGSTDGNGFMLRVDPQLVGATNGTLTPTARCSG